MQVYTIVLEPNKQINKEMFKWIAKNLENPFNLKPMSFIPLPSKNSFHIPMKELVGRHLW